MAVVDQLERVEVDEEYGHRVPGAHAAEQGVFEPLEEEEPVREARQDASCSSDRAWAFAR